MENSQKKILVAEDENFLNEMLVMIFEDEGYLVDSTVNGQDAWDLINSNHYDLLVSDLYMPKMNGFELIKLCHETFPSLKIMLLCGGGKNLKAMHEGSLVSLDGHEITIDMYMSKPCELDELLINVENVLKKTV